MERHTVSMHFVTAATALCFIGGALFGYRILFLFVIISILKWGLLLASSRHIMLTGVHPYERMLELLAPYTGQRGRVVRFLARSGTAAPKFGPTQRLVAMPPW